MKITSLTLSGYKRLMLNNIKTFVYTPASIFQLILGTNGSGKSSVLYELSPLPAQSANYLKEGFKCIELEHRGSVYILTSNFKSGNKHNFLKDGLELNPGGTGAVQKELVWQQFGISQEIHELLIGEVDFTNLSPSKRREWITKLSDIDFTYALGVYQKLKSSARDSQGALKHVQSRLVGENNKLLAIGAVEDLEEKYKALHDQINFLFQQRDPNVIPLKKINTDIENALHDISRISQWLIISKEDVPGYNVFDSLESVKEALQILRTKKEVEIGLKIRISTEYSDLQEMISGYISEGIEDIDQLRARLLANDNEIISLESQLKTWTSYIGDEVIAKKELFSIKSPLIDLLHELPANPDRTFSKDALTKARELLSVNKNHLERKRNILSRAEGELEHLTSLKEEQCPKCSHRWIPGKSDTEKSRLEQVIIDVDADLKQLVSDIERDETYIESAEDYGYKLTSIRKLMHQTVNLNEFWDSVLQDDLLYLAPASIVPRIYGFELDLDKLVKLDTLFTTDKHLRELLSGDSDGTQITMVKTRLRTLEGEIENAIVKISGFDKEEKELKKFFDHLDDYLRISDNLEAELVTLHGLRDDYVNSLRDSEIANVLASQQTQLAVLQTKRSEKMAVEGIIQDLENDSVRLKDEFDAKTLLASELSPVDGLIAEQLTGFISSFTAHVNQVIENIWSYELRVIPCGTDNGDLDYKFPLFVQHEGKENITPDISKGSEAQVEVVNFAFRLVTMIYLGLDEYPIYLDEFSKSFDEQHRINAMNFVKKLIDTGNYTQLFMISHYAAQFGAFQQAEIMVLDSSNISVPQKHNQNVKFN